MAGSDVSRGGLGSPQRGGAGKDCAEKEGAQEEGSGRTSEVQFGFVRVVHTSVHPCPPLAESNYRGARQADREQFHFC